MKALAKLKSNQKGGTTSGSPLAKLQSAVRRVSRNDLHDAAKTALSSGSKLAPTAETTEVDAIPESPPKTPNHNSNESSDAEITPISSYVKANTPASSIVMPAPAISTSPNARRASNGTDSGGNTPKKRVSFSDTASANGIGAGIGSGSGSGSTSELYDGAIEAQMHSPLAVSSSSSSSTSTSTSTNSPTTKGLHIVGTIGTGSGSRRPSFPPVKEEVESITDVDAVPSPAPQAVIKPVVRKLQLAVSSLAKKSTDSPGASRFGALRRASLNPSAAVGLAATSKPPTAATPPVSSPISVPVPAAASFVPELESAAVIESSTVTAAIATAPTPLPAKVIPAAAPPPKKSTVTSPAALMTSPPKRVSVSSLFPSPNDPNSVSDIPNSGSTLHSSNPNPNLSNSKSHITPSIPEGDNIEFNSDLSESGNPMKRKEERSSIPNGLPPPIPPPKPPSMRKSNAQTAIYSVPVVHSRPAGSTNINMNMSAATTNPNPSPASGADRLLASAQQHQQMLNSSHSQISGISGISGGRVPKNILSTYGAPGTASAGTGATLIKDNSTSSSDGSSSDSIHKIGSESGSGHRVSLGMGLGLPSTPYTTDAINTITAVTEANAVATTQAILSLQSTVEYEIEKAMFSIRNELKTVGRKYLISIAQFPSFAFLCFPLLSFALSIHAMCDMLFYFIVASFSNSSFTHTHTHNCICIYIYIYIYTNLI